MLEHAIGFAEEIVQVHLEVVQVGDDEVVGVVVRKRSQGIDAEFV
jgi:hypothetical protein